ncbi:MAG TPA: urate hydroxylase PuuD [Actinomycetota bacterium]|nr:urate hydroxylase PuuD [Actinomycetota bacterium]
MELFTESGVALIARYLHIASGITWIGLLYYFNFVQGPAFAQFEAPARTEATRKLVPRALAWFRYSALSTWVFGVILITINVSVLGDGDWGEFFKSPYGILITTGMVLGTIMFLNVWGVIWRNQKVVIASANATASGGQADPRTPDLARRALLASRTNVVFSIPMLFFMVTAGHLSRLGSSDNKMTFTLVAGLLIAAVELNALVGLTGPTKKPLEKVGSTIWSGVILWVILYAVLEMVQN